MSLFCDVNCSENGGSIQKQPAIIPVRNKFNIKILLVSHVKITNPNFTKDFIIFVINLDLTKFDSILLSLKHKRGEAQVVSLR